MTTKQWIMIGTIVIMITLNGGPGRDGIPAAEAASLTLLDPAGQADREDGAAAEHAQASDPLEQAIGEDADSIIYDALLQGKTLAELASDYGADVNSLIRHQIGQLAAQLEERLAAGSITEEVYTAQRAELFDIVARSVHGL